MRQRRDRDWLNFLSVLSFFLNKHLNHTAERTQTSTPQNPLKQRGNFPFAPTHGSFRCRTKGSESLDGEQQPNSGSSCWRGCIWLQVGLTPAGNFSIPKRPSAVPKNAADNPKPNKPIPKLNEGVPEAHKPLVPNLSLVLEKNTKKDPPKEQSKKSLIQQRVSKHRRTH